MPEQADSVAILMAEDDEDDYLLFREACSAAGFQDCFYWVRDGEELMDYLLRRGAYQSPADAPRPALILLDLNMPKKDGRVALKEIKENPDLRQIPVIALTTSSNQEDVMHTYDLGVNSFITKPMSFEEIVEIAKQLKKYWLEIVHLPIREQDKPE